MELELKNGEIIKLEIGILFLEYLDDYSGGAKKVIEDFENKENFMYIANHFIYSAIASCYDSPLSYRQALRLVRMQDYAKIIDFISENLDVIKESIDNKSIKNVNETVQIHTKHF